MACLQCVAGAKCMRGPFRNQVSTFCCMLQSMPSAEPLTVPRRDDVGVLYTVFQQDLAINRRRNRKVPKYFAEARESAARIRRLNPLLPIALATNVGTGAARSSIAWPFGRVVDLSSVRPAGGRPLPLWLPRIHALLSSPFRLTLSLDSHATACSTGLHAALAAELAADTFDLAVNFEASACLAPAMGRTRGAGRYFFPGAGLGALGLYPHNWALLVRSSGGAHAALREWSRALGRMRRPDDQWALQAALRSLGGRRGLSANRSATSSATPSAERAAPPAAAAAGASPSSPPPPRRRLPRVARLVDAALGMKSADKTRLGFFPRYARPVRGPVILVHALRPYPWPPRSAADLCALLNADGSGRNGSSAREWRLALQPSKREPVRVHTSAETCRAALRASSPRSSRIGAPICEMLRAAPTTRTPTRDPGVAPLTEPIDSFWAWVRRVRERAGRP